MRVKLQPAWVLHSRPYRDSSALLEVLSAEYGRVGLVGRGARRRSRGGSESALLQPFAPVLLSFSGRGELRTLTGVEAAGAALALRGERLFSGMYINELLVRLVHRDDPHPRLFALYGQALEALSGRDPVDGILRRFELVLLDELGYRLDLDADGNSGEEIRDDQWYHFHPELGLVAGSVAADPARTAFSGSDLLAMARGEFDGPARPAARRLLRQALAVHLGEAPLKSRELFRRGRGEIGGNRAAGKP
jgi:DNA repair protein RecO (recombination protein O)